MTHLSLDWNATRVRAVLGPAGTQALPMPLEPPHVELALAIDLDRSVPEVGSAGLRKVRCTSQQVCHTFLPYLTATPGQGPRWHAGRHNLDARQACELVWNKLHSLAASTQGILLTVPGYLQAAQAEVLRRLGTQTRLPVLASLPTTMAAALAGHAEHFWLRSVLVIDVDEYALTLAWVKALADKAHLIESRSFPHLGLRFWKERLINALSDQFVWQHRRDPRDVPLAEQSLYDQLDVLIDAALQHRAVQLGVQGQQWFKHLVVHADQTKQFCQPLTRQVVSEAEHLLRSWPSRELSRDILLTQSAGRLPGLVEALQALVQPQASFETRLPAVKATDFDDDDFGEDLLFHDDEVRGGLMVLQPEAPARAAHGLAEQFRTGVLPAGHLETIAPLIAGGKQQAAGSSRQSPVGGPRRQRNSF